MKVGPFHMDAKMNANYSSKKDSKATQDSKYSVEYTMDVAVKAGQDSMPAGLAKVLELLGNALDVSDPEGTLEVSARKLTLVNDKATLIVTYKNNKGIFEPDAIGLFGKDNNMNSEYSFEDNNIVDDISKSKNDDSIVFEFSQANTYWLKAGGKTVEIHVQSDEKK